MNTNKRMAELLMEAASILNEGHKDKPSIKGFKYVSSDTYDEEKIKNEIRYINKNLDNILSGICKILIDGVNNNKENKDYYENDLKISPEKYFTASRMINKEFSCKNDTVELIFGFKSLDGSDMIYGAWIKNNKIDDARCIGD